jgi:hypothetical protein
VDSAALAYAFTWSGCSVLTGGGSVLSLSAGLSIFHTERTTHAMRSRCVAPTSATTRQWTLSPQRKLLIRVIAAIW